MKYFRILTTIALVLSIMSCAGSKQASKTVSDWKSAAKMEDSEIFVDVVSIKRVGTLLVAKEKKMFFTADSKDAYVTKIRDKYAAMGKAQKADKWNDFSYTIYTSEYDCLNNRFRILDVEDYDSQDVRIIKTSANKKVDRWQNVDKETVADYTFFFVCDYED